MGKFTFKPVVFEAEQFVIPDGKVLKTKEKPPGKKSHKNRAVQTDAEFHVAGKTFPVMLDKEGPYALVPCEGHYEKVRPGMWVMQSGDGLCLCENEIFRQMYEPFNRVVRPGSAADVFRGQLLGRDKHGSN